MKLLKNSLALITIFTATVLWAKRETSRPSQQQQQPTAKAPAAPASTRRAVAPAKSAPTRHVPAKKFSYADMLAAIKKMNSDDVIDADGNLQEPFIDFVMQKEKEYSLGRTWVATSLQAGLSLHGNAIDKDNYRAAFANNKVSVIEATNNIINKTSASRIIPEEEPAPTPQPEPFRPQVITRERETNIWPRKDATINPDYLKERINALLDANKTKEEILDTIYQDLKETNGAQLLLKGTSPRELEGSIKLQIETVRKNLQHERDIQPIRTQKKQQSQPKRKEEMIWYDRDTNLFTQNFLDSTITKEMVDSIKRQKRTWTVDIPEIKYVSKRIYEQLGNNIAEWAQTYERVNNKKPTFTNSEYPAIRNQIIEYLENNAARLGLSEPTQQPTMAFERLLHPSQQSATPDWYDPTTGLFKEEWLDTNTSKIIQNFSNNKPSWKENTLELKKNNVIMAIFNMHKDEWLALYYARPDKQGQKRETAPIWHQIKNYLDKHEAKFSPTTAFERLPQQTPDAPTTTSQQPTTAFERLLQQAQPPADTPKPTTSKGSTAFERLLQAK